MNGTDIAFVSTSDMERMEQEVVTMLQKIGIAPASVSTDPDAELDDMVQLSVEDISINEDEPDVGVALGKAEPSIQDVVADQKNVTIVPDIGQSKTELIDLVTPISYVTVSVCALYMATEPASIHDNYGITLILSLLVINAGVAGWKYAKGK